ncbi:unnamed protein product [Rotaria socialis]|uniref:VWFA domain-containing protein n=1 Tax=Rotaria socialis TaxID=392032 RepID=A0A817QDD3_9BILA|nr:unnamed protein product [Rotaria socialis]CAF3227550.1 unnamed protein product [Rotaria socialis]CAF3391513.1 unnamed protein product [Rotaria socialis]CAF3611351.1 unnamed protein product [Rotaria socialis]CAF3683683.1 unnamed protein product [Rotaria socialis]
MASTHSSSILDLSFAMDCTGSMGAYIKSATDNIRSIVDEIVSKEMTNIRLALVEYRDHPPQDTTFVTRVHNFTDKVQEMKAWLEQCSAQGGGDTPEAVADALHDILKLSWRSEATKICVLISDAPPHGLKQCDDSFPDGCPLGHDPLKIAREMAEKNITLYVVGVEPPILPYREFFMALAHITGGQYVPMMNANLLAQMIIAGVREEISLDRVMNSSRKDIIKVIQKATSDGVDDQETAKRLQNVFISKKIQVNRMKNEAGVPSKEAEECYAKCADMADMQSKYKKTEPTSTTHVASMDYGLQEEENVTVEQAKRILQKAKNWEIPSSKEGHQTERKSFTTSHRSRKSEDTQRDHSTPCKYGSSCYDHTDYHRAKYYHPEGNKRQGMRTNQQTSCKYGSSCYDHTDYHRAKYYHPESDTKQKTQNIQHTPCKYGSGCRDRSEYHRDKYYHA